MVQLYENLCLIGAMAKRFQIEGETLLAMPEDVLNSLLVVEIEGLRCPQK